VGAAQQAAAAARAGVDLVQVRERGLEDRALVALAVALRDAMSGAGARMIVNDRIDVALAAGANGVHLPASALPCARARAIVPDGFLVGRSVHSAAEAVTAEGSGGCDYLIFGTVFESASKPAGHRVAGVRALAEVCAAVRLPVLAIGGITTARIPDVVRAGAAGIAAVDCSRRRRTGAARYRRRDPGGVRVILTPFQEHGSRVSLATADPFQGRGRGTLPDGCPRPLPRPAREQVALLVAVGRPDPRLRRWPIARCRRRR
jgi:thiamine-phosphate pyrophosphorylase